MKLPPQELLNYIKSQPQIPTHKQAAEHFGVNESTVKRRYATLYKTGQVEKRREIKTDETPNVRAYRGQLSDALGMSWEV